MSVPWRNKGFVQTANGGYEYRDGSEQAVRSIRGGDVLATNTGSVRVVTDSNGLFVVTGLDEGLYRLHQTEAVPGYNNAGDAVFCISGDRHTQLVNGEYVSNIDNPDFSGAYGLAGNERDDRFRSTYRLDDNWICTDIVMTSGIVLPTTGGPGIGLYLISGAVLVLAAGYAIRRKARI